MAPHPHAPEGVVILGGTIAGRVPRHMLDQSPFSASIREFLSHRPSSPTTYNTPAATVSTLSSSAPATPVETFRTVVTRVSLLTLEELATLTDTLPAFLHPSVGQLLRYRLTSPASELGAAEEVAPTAEEVTTAVTSPPAVVPSRDATGRFIPGAAAMDAPANAPPALDDACTDSVIAIATYLFNRARGPPVPPPWP